MKAASRAKRDGQRVGRLKVLAQDGVLSRNFGDGIGVDDVHSRGKCLPEGNLNTGSTSFEVEVLVTECGRAADVVD